jgi:hypothetical protein
MTNGDLAKGSADNLPKKRNYNGKLSLKTLDRKIKRVYDNIKQEIKVHDHSIPSFLPTRDGAAGDMKHLTGIAQGDSETTRDGQQINIKSLQVKGQMYLDTAIQSSTVRLIIFVDKNFLGSGVPSALNLLDGTGYFGTPQAPYVMRNRKERERFKILFDKVYSLNTNGANTLPINIYRRLNMKSTFSGINATDTGKNNIFLIAISGQAMDDRPTLDLLSRVSFTDS